MCVCVYTFAPIVKGVNKIRPNYFAENVTSERDIRTLKFPFNNPLEMPPTHISLSHVPSIVSSSGLARNQFRARVPYVHAKCTRADPADARRGPGIMSTRTLVRSHIFRLPYPGLPNPLTVSRATCVVMLLFVYTKGRFEHGTHVPVLLGTGTARYCVEMRGRAMPRNY